MRYIIAIILVLFCWSYVFGASTAKQVDFLAAGLEKDGDACSGCKVYTYETGTTTAKATYLDRAKASPATNPIVLDSEGRAEVFGDGLYKFVIKEADDTAYFDIDGLDYSKSGSEIVYLSQYNSLEEAVADRGSTDTTIVIDTTATLNHNLTIAGDIGFLVIEPVSVDLNGYTLTMNGYIMAPPYQWIIGSSGTFTGSPTVDYYNPVWIKSSITDTTTPNYKAITLGEPTLTVPVIADFSNSTHNHSSDSTGGLLTSSVRDIYRNLTITNSTEKVVALTADEAILQDTNGAILRLASVNTSIDITNSGAHGLDVAPELTSTWFYIWLIGNSTSHAGLISNSSSAPTLPSGYTYRGLFGSVYNDGSDNFEEFYQIDSHVSVPRKTVTSTVSDFAATSSSKDISSFIPSIAKEYAGYIEATNGAGTPKGVGVTYTSGTPTTASRFTVDYIPASTSNAFSFSVPVTNSTTYLYRADANINAATFYITGWGY